MKVIPNQTNVSVNPHLSFDQFKQNKDSNISKVNIIKPTVPTVGNPSGVIRPIKENKYRLMVEKLGATSKIYQNMIRFTIGNLFSHHLKISTLMVQVV